MLVWTTRCYDLVINSRFDTKFLEVTGKIAVPQPFLSNSEKSPLVSSLASSVASCDLREVYLFQAIWKR